VDTDVGSVGSVNLFSTGITHGSYVLHGGVGLSKEELMKV
jgi:hypothetical protein